VLITGFDILFFWVARMMMMQLRRGRATSPSTPSMCTQLVRDEKGKKMSKTLGNVIDPLELIDEYGADARALHLTPPWPPSGRAEALDRSASRATATSAPSSGTPRASPR
jgi:leucyl-tRNA synthetase